MELVLQADSDETKAQRHENEVGRPQGMQTVLWLPHAIVARGKPERNTIATELPVQQPDEDANPVNEAEGRRTRDRKAVQTAGFLRSLEPDGSQGVECNVESEADGVEAGND